MKAMMILGLIFGVTITIFTYLIILGSNMNKTEDEKLREDQEQIEYLKNYRKKKENKKWI